MKSTASVHKGGQIVTITLDASELKELSIRCELCCVPRVSTNTGEAYSSDTLRVLCMSGTAFARRRLGLSNGLVVNVSDVHGVIEHFDDVGVCHATALAIAKSLQHDVNAIVDSLGEWELSPSSVEFGT